MSKVMVLAVVVLVIAGCVPDPQPGGDTTSGSPVYYWHDDAHGVSCWLYGSTASTGKAISCLPDSQVHR